jgi:DNA-binding response OmpR family regulator
VQLEAVRPDAVVLDLMMPLMDGRTFVHEMRARGDDVPVLVVSGSDAERAADELGVEGGLAKPFDPAVLVARLRAVGTS